MKKTMIVGLALILSGCAGFSATTLRCGTDADASYVEVTSAPQEIANSTRALATLCGFAYDQGKPE